jgi:RNA-directed DNA polymerase
MLAPGLCGGTQARQAETSRHRDGPLDAPGGSYPAEDSEVGTAYDLGKDMTEVRSPPRTRRPDTVGSDHQQPTSLPGRANKANTDTQPRCRALYGCLKADLVLDCWRDRKKPAASGVDGRTAAAYQANLQANITALVHRRNTQRYRAKLVRRCYIPTANGADRPLGIPAREDQRVQLACAKLVMAIYEQDLRACRDGYRPGRGALEAVRDLPVALQYGTYGYLVEADVQGVFDQLDPTRLLARLRERIDDRAFLRLIRQGRQAGRLETDGQVVQPEPGSPPGGSLSPVLAKVSRPYALDVWFATVVKAHGRGEARLGRDADDWVCACRYQDDAERC